MSLCWQKSVWSKLSHPLSSPSPPAFSLSQHQGLFQWVSSSHQVAKVLDDRGWDGWLASPAWWTWVWGSSGSWWWTGKSGMLQPMGSQRVRHNWVTELSQSHGFSSSHIWCASWAHNEGWMIKNWCFWILLLEKTLESPLDCKKIQPVHPKGNQPWLFIGRTNAEAEAPVLWPPDVKSWLTGKDPDSEKDWAQEEKGATEG